MLAARFPQTFVADSSRPHRPLKLGIDLDLVARGGSGILNRALSGNSA
jgi:sRNA-binding protein